ncbi:MAG: hypothetical protein ACRCY3_07250 [Sphingorhabdus sp.]
MKKILIALTLAGIGTHVQAQEMSELIGKLQNDGYVSIADIREMRSKQFDTLDKDKSGGLSSEEAQGALSIANRGGGQGGGTMMQGRRGEGMSAEQRKAMRERMQQARRNGGEGGGSRQGRKGAGGMAGGGNQLGRMQFMAADGDFDGQLTRIEFIEAPIPMLVEADKDMDTRITVEEIQQLRNATASRAGAAMPGMDGAMQE